ncbi:hypothetical protein BU16DRAFT_605270 [Lophium mytilinum]|uniref:Uncharacterized protein n=1 Tax=Lophium mytilinum TaxID=390894 RepID=A0A6A6R283_9PEZI|nr:hypothetical protein BU16DRAFT_605270 [Lophium mytilinum]
MTPPLVRLSASEEKVEEAITLWQQELKDECTRRLGVLPPFINTNLDALRERLAKATQETRVLQSEGIVDGENFASLHSSSGRPQSALEALQSSITGFDPLLTSLEDIKSSLASFKSSVGAVWPLLAYADREQSQVADPSPNSVNAETGAGVFLSNSLNADADDSASTHSSEVVDASTDISRIHLALTAANTALERKRRKFADTLLLIKTLVKSVEDDAVRRCAGLTSALESLQISSEKELGREQSANRQRRTRAVTAVELLNNRLRKQRRVHMSTNRQLKRQIDHMTQVSRRRTATLTEKEAEKDAEIDRLKQMYNEQKRRADDLQNVTIADGNTINRLETANIGLHNLLLEDRARVAEVNQRVRTLEVTILQMVADITIAGVQTEFVPEGT